MISPVRFSPRSKNYTNLIYTTSSRLSNFAGYAMCGDSNTGLLNRRNFLALKMGWVVHRLWKVFPRYLGGGEPFTITLPLLSLSSAKRHQISTLPLPSFTAASTSGPKSFEWQEAVFCHNHQDSHAYYRPKARTGPTKWQGSFCTPLRMIRMGKLLSAGNRRRRSRSPLNTLGNQVLG